MKPKIVALLAGASLLVVAMAYAAPNASTDKGAWAERVQVIYVAETRSVVRKTVRVWDAHPEKNLDFVWEPAVGHGAGVAEDGTISGKGKLVWRVRGSASYDPRTIYSEYEGDLVNGRPHGKGRLEIRSGETYDGDWAAGVLDGRGVSVDAEGNRYEGDFANGLPNGKGRYLARTGEIFDGNFVTGKRDGKGTTRLAGGTVYESEWRRGVEIGGNRPDVLADAQVGGLLKVQSGGDAGKVEISTIVDDRMNQQAAMQYQHLVRDEDIAIYPLADEMNNAWNGTAPIDYSTFAFDGIDWADAPAFVEVEVKTTDGTRVELKTLELQVKNSEAYRKPMLTLERHFGCVGFRPSFSLKNHGWGQVKGAKVNFTFGPQEEGGAQSRPFSANVGDFDQGADVWIKDALDQAGVSTAKLETERFKCDSVDALNVCRSQVFNTVGFGEIADFIWGEENLNTTMRGTVDYSWADDNGNSYQASEPFQVDVALAVIELPEVLAECGDGFGGSPEALRYQRVDLPLGQRDYVVDMPVRGNNKISQYEARLKMYAEMSSFHQFEPVAKFADGSERRGKPVSLFYYLPHPSEFLSTAKPAACYLPPELEGC
ncbi:MAG TPA: hypothetical protein VMF90_03435 [Rhizobiaceae bacterium]|nr:hypothetical protein [Rhizobiaceae bacterium]